ncbi:tRNA (guanine-N(7)-)-methyltransferase non-catalytic subunit wdr4-like [Watersipora subatra]|uniref:tRNA (guanine-N(7)-)-methyltransferase non-catalytic subunit wdr4-like n=1 Tax=Watersipora subatra TaxID=2589382 RepID=UPI00355AFC8C
MYPVIACTDKYLLVSTLNKTCLLYDLTAEKHLPLVLESTAQKEKEVDLEAKGVVLHAAFSNNSLHFALCNDYKQLLLYSSTTLGENKSSPWKLSSTRSTAKKGVKVEFAPDDKSLVIADKLGVVTQYSVDDPDKEGVILLGHISVLLDCKFICSGQYLATCDRDEKIRISFYPNTFEIQAFCLGHRKHVTSLAEAEPWLVSGSGDGTVKLWDPETGKLLSEHHCHGDRIVQQIVYMKEAKKVICLLNDCNRLLGLSIESNSGNAFFQKHVEEMDLTAPALAFCKYSENSLIVLVNNSKKPLESLSVGINSSSALPCLSSICQHLESLWSSMAGAADLQRAFHADITKMDMLSIEQSGKKLKVDSTHANSSCLPQPT